MIVSQLKGGLGNMMFQISAGVSLAKDLNTEFYYTYINWNSCTQHKITHYPNTIFKNLNKLDIIPNNLFNYVYDEPNYLEINKNDNIILDGYFQSDKYFLNNKDYIKNIFDIKFIDKFKDYCFLHIRRGDYLKFSHVHNILPEEYYINALNIINPLNVVILTDDKQFVKDNKFFNKFELFESNLDLDDLSVMASCCNGIICNSTFSWWGAFFGDKDKIIAPKKWFNHLEFEKYKDIYTNEMILI